MAKNMVLIKDGTVVNILWCSDREPETETLIDPGECPVRIGDTYADGSFYRDEVKVLTPLEKYQKQNAALTADLAALDEEYRKGVDSL